MANRADGDCQRADVLPADLTRLMELVVTRHVWGRGLSGERVQAKLASALDEGRRHLVSVQAGKDGNLNIEFSPELGDVGRAFTEASKTAPVQSSYLRGIDCR